jgi:hypothetical protein
MPDNDTAGIASVARDKRLLVAVVMLGLIGVATLGFAPLETILPPKLHLPRAALLIQPAIFTVLCALLGWWTLPRTGLDAPVLRGLIEKSDWSAPLRRGLPAAAGTAALVSVILVIYALATAQVVLNMPQLDIPLISRLGYGGLGEEIIARWGLLTAFMALAMRLGQSRSAAFWSANTMAALLFAFGHFGVLFALMPHPPLWLLIAVVLGNFVPAAAFGLLYRQFGIESAMIAHAGAHALFWTVAAAGYVAA